MNYYEKIVIRNFIENFILDSDFFLYSMDFPRDFTKRVGLHFTVIKVSS